MREASGAEWNRTKYTYDGAGRRTGVTLANNSSRTYVYNRAGELVETSGGPEGELAYEYDSMGRQTVVTDANDRTRKTFYDALGRVTEVKNEMNQSVIYRYDIAGRRTELEDAKGNVTVYKYDDDSRLVKMTYPSVAGAPEDIEGYAYDAAGLMTSKITPNGVTIGYGYNDAGALASVSFGGRTVTYNRDDAGAVTGIADSATTTVSYTYDGFGRLISSSDAALGHSLGYDYDKRGLRTSASLDDVQPQDPVTLISHPSRPTLEAYGGGMMGAQRLGVDSAAA